MTASDAPRATAVQAEAPATGATQPVLPDELTSRQCWLTFLTCE